MAPATSRRLVRFGTFELDLENRRLTKSGYRIRIQEQPFQLLAFLIEREGKVVTREELKERLWPGDTFVEFDSGLNTAIKKLRAALSDSPNSPRFVETVPRVGYRFLAPVLPVEALSHSVDPASLTAEPVESPEILPEIPAFTESSRSRVRWAWTVSAVLGILIIAVVLLRIWLRPESHAGFQSIAVLPLQNLSGDPGQEYISDGMTDELITELAKLAGPQVISRTSAMHYKGTNKTIPEIARELHVEALVEGSVERSGDRMRVRIQLIEAKSDQHIWADTYDRQFNDILRLESDVAQDIAHQIQFRLTSEQQQKLASNHVTNPQAFQDYLQGRVYWATRTDEGLQKAVEYFNRAIQEDPKDARSYAGLAHCYIVLPLLYEQPARQSYTRAAAAAEKALALDPSLADAHLAMAEISFYQNWDFAQAEREFKRSLELNPNYSTAHQWYAEFLSILDRRDEAIGEVQMALTLDPLSAVVHHQAGQVLQQARMYDQAMAEYRQALTLNASFGASQESMSWAFRRQHKYQDAVRELRATVPRYERLYPGLSASLEAVEKGLAARGRDGFLRSSLEFHRHYSRPSLYIARDYAELGDAEHAFEFLQQAADNHDVEFLNMPTDPEFDTLRNRPEYLKLLALTQKH